MGGTERARIWTCVLCVLAVPMTIASCSGDDDDASGADGTVFAAATASSPDGSGVDGADATVSSLPVTSADGPGLEPEETGSAPPGSGPVTGGADDVPLATTAEPGSVDETVPAIPMRLNEPISMDETGEFGDGVEVRVISTESIDADTVLPGEVGGPSIALTIEFENSSGQRVNLDATTIDLIYGDQLSASKVSTEPAAPAVGGLAPGERRSGLYVFTLPAQQRVDITLTVKYSAPTATVVFTGSVADG